MFLLEKRAITTDGDWGPRLVTSGIWRPIKLKSWDKVRIKDFNISYNFDGHTFIKTDVLVESSTQNQRATLKITVNDSTVVSAKMILKKGEQNLVHNFSLENPKLWWPNGIGKQNLYDFKAEVEFNNKTIFLNQKLRNLYERVSSGKLRSCYQRN